MPIRNRHGIWHYRFWLDGREYTGSTDLVATERNRNAATRDEAKARELVRQRSTPRTQTPGKAFQ